MNTTKWWEYVQRVTNNAGGAEIARKVEFDPSAISRWKKGENPRWDFAVKFARAYNRNVLEALAAADFITEEDANLREVKVGVQDIGTTALLEEVMRRVEHQKL